LGCTTPMVVLCIQPYPILFNTVLCMQILMKWTDYSNKSLSLKSLLSFYKSVNLYSSRENFDNWPLKGQSHEIDLALIDIT